jgi:excisionase family DNA binding protein
MVDPIGPGPLPGASDRPTLTIEEAGDYLRICRASAYAAARRGEIPTISCGRRKLVPTAKFRQLLGLDGVETVAVESAST